MKIKHAFTALASITALTFGTAAMATTLTAPQGQATDVATQDRGDHVSDAAITVNVQSALMAQSGGAQVTVETTEGVVTLSGEVATHEDYIAFERIARETEGVQGVENQLEVKEE